MYTITIYPTVTAYPSFSRLVLQKDENEQNKVRPRLLNAIGCKRIITQREDHIFSTKIATWAGLFKAGLR